MNKRFKQVFELVIVDPMSSINEIAFLGDLSEEAQESLIRTKIRVFDSSTLNLACACVENRMLGLASKTRYHLLSGAKERSLSVYKTGDKTIYPLYRQSASLGGSWVVNPELKHLFI